MAVSSGNRALPYAVFSNYAASVLATLFSFWFFLQILLMKKEIVPHELEFLLRFPAVMNVTSPVDFLSNICWGGIKVRG